MVFEVTGSGLVKHKGSDNPTLEPESRGRTVPSEGEVSGSGDSGTRTYLVFNMGGKCLWPIPQRPPRSG